MTNQNIYPNRLGILFFKDGSYELDKRGVDIAPNVPYVREDSVEKFLRIIKYIANDYVELSHDKVRLQRDDHMKLCRKFLEEYYKEDRGDVV